MLKFLPNISLGFEAGLGPRALQPVHEQQCVPCAAQTEHAAAQAAMNRSRAESIAFARLSAEFRLFAGSDRNAQSLVIGLRDGTDIMLTDRVNGGPSAVTFTPPTGRMGYSNVSITLSLARQYLAAQGIAQPSMQQLQAVLVGGAISSPLSGSTVELNGILQMKLRGAGWGKIAAVLGVKLGSVIGEPRPVPAVLPSRAKGYASVATKVATIVKHPSAKEASG
ncbi:MAG TPA: hypothetical protein VLV32_09220 [Burkholderiales bacterium]|nr:hypothetical protein [Burkholderiales bacterium]